VNDVECPELATAPTQGAECRLLFGYPLRTWLTAILLLGIALRGWHYLRNDPMWHDEAALVVNVLTKTYPEIWGPRLFNETGPPLFLWLEKAVVAVLGDSTHALRLIPLLAGIAGLFVLRRGLRPILTPVELMLLLFMFAISDRLLWHCTEAKMYSTDVLLACLLIAMFVRYEKSRPSWNECLLLAASSGLMFFSYAIVFLLPAYGLARLPALIRSRSIASWIGMAAFGLAFLGCFYVLSAGPVAAIRTSELVQGWQNDFPNWSNPTSVAYDIFRRTWEAFRYSLEPVGHVMMPFAIWGIVTLTRRGHGTLAAFLATTIGLNIVTWLLGKYPIGATRVCAFLAPACLTLIAVGTGRLIDRCAERIGRFAWGISLPILAAVILAFASLILPWRRLQMDGPADLVLTSRGSDEPVVGWYWEHHYYFRSIASFRVDVPPRVMDRETIGFWYLHHTTAKPHHLQDPYWPLPHLESSRWKSRVWHFRDYDVWHFEQIAVD